MCPNSSTKKATDTVEEVTMLFSIQLEESVLIKAACSHRASERKGETDSTRGQKDEGVLKASL